MPAGCIQLVGAVVVGLFTGLGQEGCPDGGGGVSEPLFVEVGADRGIGDYTMAVGMTAGVAAADFDDDGDIDIFVPNGNGVPDQLYRNLGNGHYEEVASQFGLASMLNSRMALWIDYDGDGRLDLVVARDWFSFFGLCWPFDPIAEPASTLALYRQTESGGFEDVTVQADLQVSFVEHSKTHLGGMVAGDINRDGYLDLCFTEWGGEVKLLVNDGDGTFTDISLSSNVGVEHGDYWQPVMHDFDNDGWLDIYVLRDFDPNQLWINRENNVFVDEASVCGGDNAMNDMGALLVDFDNDGDFDIYVTNITDEPFASQDEHNVLLRNDTVGTVMSFSDVSESVGVANGEWGWGATALDADNDGWQEIAATNGWCNGWPDDPSHLFWNQGGESVTFVDCTTAGVSDTEWGSCLISFDSNRDGRLDLLQTCNLGGPLRLMENQPTVTGEDNRYLVIKPRSSGPNSHSIGATVSVHFDRSSYHRLITAGTSSLGQEPAEAFFGIGEQDKVDRVDVSWPDGTVRSLTNVFANQIVTIWKPTCSVADTDGDGTIGVDDLINVILAWGTDGFNEPKDGVMSDATGDGTVNVDDLITVILAWGDC